MSIRFRVSEVERAPLPLRAPAGAAWEPLGSPVEAWGVNAAGPVLGSSHGLLEAVECAFSGHYPLVLTPDGIWLCIAQAFATHVKENAERLRGKFVRHEGKEILCVRRDDFIKGSRENPWPEAFSCFSEQIAARIGRQRDLVVCDFSTTGPCERAASEIVLMDAMQSYFSYEMLTSCGIPEITLEGTLDDWRSIRRRARALEEYELDWWVAGLMPVLDELEATAAGRIDVAFWRSLFKLQGGSGGPYVTGWINVLFPYLQYRGVFHRNGAVTSWAEGLNEQESCGGAARADIPVGVSCVPFAWEHLGTRHSMELLGGFFGFAQDAETLALRPAIGWAVRDAETLAGPSQAARESSSSGIPIYCGRGVALFVGRISRGDSVTRREVMNLATLAGDFGDHHDVFLESAALVDVYSSIEDASMPGKVVVGLQLASVKPPASPGDREISAAARSIHDGVEKLSVLSESAWTEMGTLIQGGLAGETSLYLCCYGDVDGALVFGEPLGDGGLRGIEVASVSARGPRHVVVDASPTAHAARVAAAQTSGVEPGSGAYYLRLRRR